MHHVRVNGGEAEIEMISKGKKYDRLSANVAHDLERGRYLDPGATSHFGEFLRTLQLPEGTEVNTRVYIFFETAPAGFRFRSLAPVKANLGNGYGTDRNITLVLNIMQAYDYPCLTGIKLIRKY